MTIAAIAYAVRIVRGKSAECWMAPSAQYGGTGALCLAKLFVSEASAVREATARKVTIARVVPIVALEEAP